MPRRYVMLEHRGVPATATFEGCRHRNDVKRRTNAGFGVLLVFSSAVGLIGRADFPYLYVKARETMRAGDPSGS
jgi:hypothetical protein